MPKSKIIRSSEFPYHVSARSNNKAWFGLSPEKLWAIFSEYLYLIHKLYDIEIHCFVMMNNHFHLIMRTPQANIDLVMQYFMRETSRVIAYETGRINHVYGGAYKSSLITDHAYYFNAYKYVLRNPVKAKICKRVEEYRFSTLHGQFGFSFLLIPVVGNDEFDSNTEKFLAWVNTAPMEEETESIRKALRRREFKLSATQKTKKKADLAYPFSSPQY